MEETVLWTRVGQLRQRLAALQAHLRQSPPPLSRWQREDRPARRQLVIWCAEEDPVLGLRVVSLFPLMRSELSIVRVLPFVALYHTIPVVGS